MAQALRRIGESRPAELGAEGFDRSGAGMEPRQPIGDRPRRRQTPTRGEKLANPRQDGQVIGFDRHRLVELCRRFIVPTGHGKRLRVPRDIADIVGEQLIGLPRKLQFLLRRTRPMRERHVILRRALPQRQRLAFERRPVERSLRRFQHRTLQKPDFSEKTRDRMAAIGQPDVADLEASRDRVRHGARRDPRGRRKYQRMRRSP